MVAEPIRERQPLDRATVQRWVAEYVKGGDDPWQASRRVLQDVCESGLAEDLLALLGPAPIHQLWAGGQPKTTPRQPNRLAPEPIRRVDPAQLQESTAMLDGLDKVGGRWVRLGDMTKALCLQASRQYKQAALESAQTARFYYALAQALPERKTVREQFTDADVLRLFDEAKPS
jgi:hypothetical protein